MRNRCGKYGGKFDQQGNQNPSPGEQSGAGLSLERGR
jgi:hypothetical protein